MYKAKKKKIETQITANDVKMLSALLFLQFMLCIGKQADRYFELVSQKLNIQLQLHQLLHVSLSKCQTKKNASTQNEPIHRGQC